MNVNCNDVRAVYIAILRLVGEVEQLMGVPDFRVEDLL